MINRSWKKSKWLRVVEFCAILITSCVVSCVGKVASRQPSWNAYDAGSNIDNKDNSDSSLYLCADSPDCYLILTSTPSAENWGGQARESPYLDSDEIKSSPVRLYNGSVIGKKALVEYDPFNFHNHHHSVGGEENQSLEKPLFNKKILSPSAPIPDEAEELEEAENESRVIAYNIQPTFTSNATNAYPTITLAQLARQVLFPDWLWTRIAATRKTGVAAVTPATASTTPAIARPALPTVSFDNNFSRFLKLFTLVRFQNTVCYGPGSQNGTCYSPRDCANLGGTATTPCANGFGVCCVFQIRCGGRTSRNGTYFVSSGLTFTANQVTTCNVQILKTTPFVRQIRLDFHLFSLRQPLAGSCETDRFVVSGQDTNNVIPILCGQNSGSHIYVETSQISSNGIQLSVLTTGEGTRSWSIRVTQFEAPSFRLAPSNCLQYFTEVMGSFRSFNYISDVAPQYLNNLNYAICIRREAGFCSVTYSNAGPDGTYQPFQIVNANAAGELVIPAGQGGVGIRDCPYDYVVINGLRLCGERLNDGSTNVMFTQDASVADTSNGPFIVNVRTNEIDVGGGFNLYYRQNPCMSNSG